MPVTRVSTEEHSTAKLACAVKRSDVNVDWYKGEQALFVGQQNENNKYKRIDDGLQRELIVKNVSSDDQGDYVCQADKYRVTLHLKVQGQCTRLCRTALTGWRRSLQGPQRISFVRWRTSK